MYILFLILLFFVLNEYIIKREQKLKPLFNINEIIMMKIDKGMLLLFFYNNYNFY